MTTDELLDDLLVIHRKTVESAYRHGFADGGLISAILILLGFFLVALA